MIETKRWQNKIFFNRTSQGITKELCSIILTLWHSSRMRPPAPGTSSPCPRSCRGGGRTGGPRGRWRRLENEDSSAKTVNSKSGTKWLVDAHQWWDVSRFLTFLREYVCHPDGMVDVRRLLRILPPLVSVLHGSKVSGLHHRGHIHRLRERDRRIRERRRYKFCLFTSNLNEVAVFYFQHSRVLTF